MAYVTFPSVVKKAHNPFAGGGKVDVALPPASASFAHSSSGPRENAQIRTIGKLRISDSRPSVKHVCDAPLF
jgi:hypothetical protein